MTLQELEIRKQELRKEVQPLVELKKRLYSNMDITSPMSDEEKELNKKVASIYGEIDNIVRQKRELLRAAV